MSFSETSTVPMCCKRKASERVTGNGDPLVVKKKAHKAAAEQAEKITQVYYFFKKIIKNSLTIDIISETEC